jgi:hypothetical protein
MSPRFGLTGAGLRDCAPVGLVVRRREHCEHGGTGTCLGSCLPGDGNRSAGEDLGAADPGQLAGDVSPGVDEFSEPRPDFTLRSAELVTGYPGLAC